MRLIFKFRFCNHFRVLAHHETLIRCFSNSQDHFISLTNGENSQNFGGTWLHRSIISFTTVCSGLSSDSLFVIFVLPPQYFEIRWNGDFWSYNVFLILQNYENSRIFSVVLLLLKIFLSNKNIYIYFFVMKVSLFVHWYQEKQEY